MWLIVGLGNPGKEYEKTRHNVGFMVLDKAAGKVDSSNFVHDKKHNGQIAKVRVGDQEAILLKPQTYMNLSGESLASVAKYYKIEPEQTVVISDDVNIELGQVRVRYSGEAGGHKGLGSIISHSGLDFWRIRIGVGLNPQIPIEDYVLQKFAKDEQESVDISIDKTASYLIESISQDSFENKTL